MSYAVSPIARGKGVLPIARGAPGEARPYCSGEAGPSFAPVDLYSEGQDGILLLSGDSSAYFLTDRGQVNVSANDDTIGLALDAHLMAGVAAGAFIDALAKTAVTGWTNSGFDVFSTIGTAFEAEKTEAGGTDAAISNTYLAAVSGDFFVLEADIEANTLGGTGGPFCLSSGTNVRSTIAVIAAGQTGTVRGITHYTSGGGSPFSFSIRTTQLGVLEVSSARGAKLAGNHLTQSSSNFRPRLRTATGGLKFDGIDDRLIGTAVCGSGGNALAAKIIAPASVGSLQAIGGMQGSTSTRFYLGINTSGQLCAGVGDEGTADIFGSTDIRGQTGSAILIEDGDDVFLYWNGSLEYSGPRSGAPSTSVAVYLGALNNNGTPAAFFGGEVIDLAFRLGALDSDERANLVNYWSN